MMKLAAQKYIELKSEHFGKNSMSVFGGEFIRRRLRGQFGQRWLGRRNGYDKSASHYSS
jgi:hypothetical protein